MRFKIFGLLSAFIISFNTVCAIPVQVHASSSIDGFEDWSVEDRNYFFATHFIPIVTHCLGIVFAPSLLNFSDWLSIFETNNADLILADGCSSYDEYIASKMNLNDSGELVFDDELVDAMYNTTVEYIETYTDWYDVQFYPVNISVNGFRTQAQYNAVLSASNSLASDEVLIYAPGGYSYVGLGYVSWYAVVKHDAFVLNAKNGTLTSAYNYYAWNSCSLNSENVVFVDTNGKTYTYDEFKNQSSIPTEYSATSYAYNRYSQSESVGAYSWGTLRYSFGNTSYHRVYKTFDAMKQYSVGNRPYYMTSDFKDYDINGDNSCIISESELENSSVYGDVYNIIINYPDADGLTEEELRAILDEYFNGSGSGSGSGSDDDSGGGLFDFLDGLGGFFDGILSVLGKLLEYIGKAVTLVTDTLSSIVDKIPASVTGMMTAVFPMLPEEWFSIIELALVLGVLGIVIKLLKG